MRIFRFVSVLIPIGPVIAAGALLLQAIALPSPAFASVASRTASWETDLTALIRADHPDTMDLLMRRILAAGPSWGEVSSRLRAIPFDAPALRGGFVADSAKCIDGAVRPYLVYIPSAYDPAEPAPLLVYLHGGVGRTEMISPEDYLENLSSDSDFVKLAESRGWLMLFPLGQAGATWWDRVGMANIRTQIREVKRRYNTDDDRVWMTGFSDGASGSYGFAMLSPDDFAAFVPLCGHPGVAGLAGELETFAPNLSNTPVYAVNTDGDALYPSAEMARIVEMAAAAGADIAFREYRGFTHTPDFLPFDIPNIARFLEGRPRDPFRPRLHWETADPEFGSCRWFSTVGIHPCDAADWHKDHNMILVDKRITFGFMMDNAFEGPGVRVDRLVDGDTPVRRAGLEAGDVILACNDYPTPDARRLDDFKTTVKRGDPFSMLVDRNGSRLEISGSFPPPQNRFLFPRRAPSAAARVQAVGNRVLVQGSRLSSFSVRVHPGMFQIDHPIIIEADGATVFDSVVQPDIEYMLRNFLENRDRRLIHVAEIRVELES